MPPTTTTTFHGTATLGQPQAEQEVDSACGQEGSTAPLFSSHVGKAGAALSWGSLLISQDTLG